MPHSTTRKLQRKIAAFRLATCHPLERVAQNIYFVPIKLLRLHNIMTGTRVPKRIALGQRFAGVSVLIRGILALTLV
jgi:hypothetical protein